MKFTKTLPALLIALGLASLNTNAVAKDRETGRGTGPVIYVTSQGLYYDSIVLADLPMQGEFQQLVPGEDGLSTEFGPGQPGHLGGRWWIDANGDGAQNEGDLFFMCPLLGPGRTTF